MNDFKLFEGQIIFLTEVLPSLYDESDESEFTGINPLSSIV